MVAERIAVVTDSTCDLPVSVLKAEGIFMIPLSIFFGDEEYQDGIDLSPEQYYAKLQSSPHFPTTSQPSPGKFLELFQQLQKEGYTHIFCLHLSRKFSGTVQSATVAANMLPDLQIQVVDSRICSWGLGGLVLYANKLVKEGISFQLLVEKVKKLIPQIAVFFSVDNLDSLKRGGRIGKAQALIGQYLGIRPIMCMREGQGEIEVVTKVRSVEAACRVIVQLASEHIRKYGVTQQAVVVYAAVPKYQDLLMEAVRQETTDFGELFSGRIGGVIGAHLGPTGWGLTIC